MALLPIFCVTGTDRWGFGLRGDSGGVDFWCTFVIGENGIDWGLLMAGGTLVGLLATVLFLLVQRKLVGGLTAGAVKG
jgi:ABC-type glycerol-3-phosphate transport system permease component